MNIEQFCNDYWAAVESLPTALEFARSGSLEQVEQIGFSLEETLLWREEALARADVFMTKKIRDTDRRLEAFAGELHEYLGVNVQAFLAPKQVQEVRRFG